MEGMKQDWFASRCAVRGVYYPPAERFKACLDNGMRTIRVYFTTAYDSRMSILMIYFSVCAEYVTDVA